MTFQKSHWQWQLERRLPISTHSQSQDISRYLQKPWRNIWREILGALQKPNRLLFLTMIPMKWLQFWGEILIFRASSSAGSCLSSPSAPPAAISNVIFELKWSLDPSSGVVRKSAVVWFCCWNWSGFLDPYERKAGIRKGENSEEDIDLKNSSWVCRCFPQNKIRRISWC